MRTRRQRWTTDDIPDQSGRVAVVTGANTGLGFEAAQALAGRGATVVLACRDLAKAESAADRIRERTDPTKVQTVRLDLAALASVRQAADEIRSNHTQLDLLINNAGVMDVPYQTTEDGFELTLATNHLGPFALTGHLLDRLLATRGSRIVTVSSIAHRRGVIDFDDLQSARRYERPYARSKLANLLFTYELDRRLRATDAETTAVAAHPGNARTDLYRTSGRLERTLLSYQLRHLTGWLAQGSSTGALPTLRAAVDPDAHGGDFYGPPGRFQFTGYPTRVESIPASHDEATQRRLWKVSEQLTGVSYGSALPG